MSTHIIKMPDIGEGIAEVELVEWHVQPGDRVTEDQVLADVMTDKATVPVPSPVNGTVLSLGGKVGEIMAVGSDLIHLDADEETVSVETSDASSKPAGKPLASPSVRKHAFDLGVDLKDVSVTSANGRITHQDLDRYAAVDEGVGASRASLQAPTPGDSEQVPVVGIRRKIGERLQESARRIPHFTYVEEVDVTEAEALRLRLNEQWAGQRSRLTVLPLLVRAMVIALREFPQINARYNDEEGVINRYAAVHMGIAAQTESGLMVPVLRNAQALDLWESADEIARLADAAKKGHATRDELSGSTITLSSLGALGGIVSTPIINYPEVAIVGGNRIVERPAIFQGAMVARKLMNLSSSFDHRVVDGMDAAQFIQRVRTLLECPALLFIE